MGMFGKKPEPSSAGGYDTKGYDAKGYDAKGYDTKAEPQNAAVADEVDTSSPQQAPPKGQWILLFTSLCMAVFCQALDNTILATAIPRITDQFQSLDDVGWYGSSYLLTTCAFQLSYGKLYNLFPIKWVFLSALAFFQLGSLICGAAPNSLALIMGRVVAGIGSGGIFSGALLIVAQNLPLQQRPIYNGMLGSMYAISSVAGPLMGGAFTDNVTWRLCFYINLPIGLLTAICIFFFLNKEAGRNDRWDLPLKDKIFELDIYGVVALIPAIVCILLALQFGGSTYGWNSWRVILLLVLFVVLFGIFIFIQFKQGDRATIPPTVIKVRTMWACGVYAFFFFGSFLSITYYLPIWFQAIRGDSATESGINNLPFLLGTVVFSIIAGGAVFGVGYYTWACIVGSVMASVGAGLLSTFTVNTAKGAWIGYQIIYGGGIGFGLQQPLIAVQTALPDRQVSEGTAIITFIQAFGGTIFISVAQNVFNNQLLSNVVSRNIPINPAALLSEGATRLAELAPEGFLEPLREAYNAALTQTFYVTVATAALSTLGAAFIPWLSVKKEKAAPKKDEEHEMASSDRENSPSPDVAHAYMKDDVENQASPAKDLPRLPLPRQASNMSENFQSRFGDKASIKSPSVHNGSIRPDPRDQQLEKETQHFHRDAELHERNAQLFDKKARLYDKNVELYERNVRLYDMNSRLYDKSVNRYDREAEQVGLSRSRF
ncbi:major facilitator superfamily domain-containing protein [Elsinoe ampelina]|uniref:Major facilitator superfamily domain-containing protein n=1 Tax=Elsinoe ampelina TaxID=302913 RepID=A0A6A6G1E6_9PEZI|nr:major facilitator superfamily domain-containing protein [Elsinoe ampelina]